MRTVTFFTDRDKTTNWKLRVWNMVSNDHIVVEGKHTSYNTNDNQMNWRSARSFSATLPGGMGPYQAEFIDAEGEVSWPIWVQEVWEAAPSCEDYLTAEDITLVEPPMMGDQCIHFPYGDA